MPGLPARRVVRAVVVEPAWRLEAREGQSPRGAEVVVAHTRRFEREDEAFFALLAERFDVAPVPPDELHPTFGRGGDAGLTGVLRLRARAEREAGVT